MIEIGGRWLFADYLRLSILSTVGQLCAAIEAKIQKAEHNDDIRVCYIVHSKAILNDNEQLLGSLDMAMEVLHVYVHLDRGARYMAPPPYTGRNKRVREVEDDEAPEEDAFPLKRRCVYY